MTPYDIGLLIPSLGRGVMVCVVAGRGLYAMYVAETPPCTLPLGGNRTGHWTKAFIFIGLYIPSAEL
jgi:hypothetical protein